MPSRVDLGHPTKEDGRGHPTKEDGRGEGGGDESGSDKRGDGAGETKPSSKQRHPLTGIAKPGPNDRLLGRGAGANNHPGNKKYLKMVEDRREKYAASEWPDKPLVAMEIVNEWRALDPPGRFLRKDDKTKLWNDVGDEVARERTKQALRTGQPERQSPQRRRHLEEFERAMTAFRKRGRVDEQDGADSRAGLQQQQQQQVNLDEANAKGPVSRKRGRVDEGDDGADLKAGLQTRLGEARVQQQLQMRLEEANAKSTESRMRLEGGDSSQHLTMTSEPIQYVYPPPSKEQVAQALRQQVEHPSQQQVMAQAQQIVMAKFHFMMDPEVETRQRMAQHSAVEEQLKSLQQQIMAQQAIEHSGRGRLGPENTGDNQLCNDAVHRQRQVLSPEAQQQADDNVSLNHQLICPKCNDEGIVNVIGSEAVCMTHGEVEAVASGGAAEGSPTDRATNEAAASAPAESPPDAAGIDVDITDLNSMPIIPPGKIPEGERKISEDDVLCCGNYKAGNTRFLELVRDYHPVYLMANNSEKLAIAMKIVSIVRSRGGRFLRRGGGRKGKLYELGDLKAESYTKAALRGQGKHLKLV